MNCPVCNNFMYEGQGIIPYCDKCSTMQPTKTPLQHLQAEMDQLKIDHEIEKQSEYTRGFNDGVEHERGNYQRPNVK